MTRQLINIDGRRLMTPLPDGAMAALRFGREGAPPLLFAHANGFCASAYRQMLTALGTRFDVFAVDLRGHGRSTLSRRDMAHRGLDIFAADIRIFLDALAASGQVGGRWTLAGHSLGGDSVTMASVGRQDIARLRLIEPVAMPPFLRGLAQLPFWRLIARRTPLARMARQRRSEWPDRDQVKASYARKPLFQTWAAGVLEDYLADGLRPVPAGVTLACSPAWEAANFMAQAHDFWAAAARTPAPISVLAADHASTTVPASSRRRFARLGAEIRTIDGATHLCPFEKPSEAAEFLASA